MILKRIKLEPFGGLTSKALSFDRGLNVVLGPNEAGKSTVFQAILCCLFTNTQLTKPQFRREMQSFIPIGGDTACVEIEFVCDNSCYLLKKSWGATKRSELVLPDGTILTDEEAISTKLQELLPASEGTFKSTLASYQSALSRTIQEIEQNGEAIRSIGDILRGIFLNTDGVSIDDFKGRLDNLYTDYLGRWDLTQDQPEKGRGIENKWIKEAGIVVKSYYTMEEARIELEKAKTFEDAYDKLNREISSLDQTIIEKEEYIRKNAKTVEDARERRVISAELAACEGEIGILKEANTDWPVALNKIQETETLLLELNEKAQVLRDERLVAERAEQSRSIREQLERAKRLKAVADQAQRELETIKKLTRLDLEEIRRASEDTNRLRSSIQAGKIAARFFAKKPTVISVQKDFESSVEVRVDASETTIIDAGGRIQIAHPDWDLEITSGESKFEEVLSAFKQAQRTLDNLLKTHEIESLDHAIEVNAEYERKQQAVVTAQANLQDELGNQTLGGLEQQVAEFGYVTSARQLATIVQELTALEKDIEGKKKDLAQFKKEVQSFEEKYTSQDELMDRLANAMVKLKDTRNRMDTLVPLPPDITDVSEFIQQFERAQSELESHKERKNALALERAELEGSGPEQSVEELKSQFDEAVNVFQANLLKGKGVAKLRQVTEQLLAQMDAGTFDAFKGEVAEYIAKLTNGRYTRIEANEAIPSAFIRTDGKSIPADLLSTGTKDILGLALRLSMARHFLGHADGFVLMDDPLVDLDPERQERAIEVVRTFASHKQTILFTCHPTNAQRLAGNLCSID